jgi:hypothetical protein
MTIRKYLVLGSVALFIAYLIGYNNGHTKYRKMHKEALFLWQKAELVHLTELTINQPPVILKSGTWNLRIDIPGEPPTSHNYELQFTDNSLPKKITETRACLQETFEFNNNLVTWSFEGALYLGSANFMGVAHPGGELISGHVFHWGANQQEIGTWFLKWQKKAADNQ